MITVWIHKCKCEIDSGVKPATPVPPTPEEPVLPANDNDADILFDLDLPPEEQQPLFTKLEEPHNLPAGSDPDLPGGDDDSPPNTPVPS